MSRRCFRLPLLAALTTLALVACDQKDVDDDENEPVQLEVARSTLPRAAATAPQSDVAQAVSDDNGFAFDLYRAVREPGKNLLVSPHSISIAMAMTWAGARSQTEADLAGAMRFTLPQSQLHPAFNSLDQALNSRGQGASGKDGLPFRLNVVNAAWGQSGYHFEQSYLDTLAVNYGAGINLLDFGADPEGSRGTINDWVSQQTADRIPELLPQGSIDTLTRLVLTNAVYFNAAWEDLFIEENTIDAPFTTADGSQVSVKMMRATRSYGYAEGQDWRAVELPYDGGELSMIAVLPTGSLDDLEDSLDAAKVASIASALSTRTVNLSMPRFSFEWSSSLKPALTSLGAGIAFSDQSDFSGMNGGSERLSISDVIHKTFIAVDEKGTEAAAATAVIMAGSGIPTDEVVFALDRPFVFFIRDVQTGALVFVGRVVNPS